ncbi:MULTISPECIES: zinc-binding dehydrogenase [Terribacillus]|uniref:zinc-binding dehydrogenase n=1 Tax=Terribacillus TaxID=459532 RepID=UPI00344F693C
MHALVKKELGFGNLIIENKPEPYPEDDQVKIKVTYAGICGSDIHTYEGSYRVAAPVTLGHEFAGVVVDVGSNVSHLKPGDRVTSETTFYICGQCSYCQQKDYNLCKYRKGLGTQQDGGFATYVIARAESIHHIPDNVDDQSAAMTEALACTHHAVAKTTIRPNDIVVVIGPGPIGLLTAQVAKSKGATVLITGLSSDTVRLEKAKELGIDYVINVQEESLEEIISGLTDGYGADVVFECSGAIPAARQGLSLLRKKGQYAQVGLFAEAAIPFDMEQVIQKELKIIGSRSQKPADWEPSLHLMESGAVDAAALVTHIFDITEWEKAYQLIKSGEAIKVLLTPTKER